MFSDFDDDEVVQDVTMIEDENTSKNGWSNMFSKSNL